MLKQVYKILSVKFYATIVPHLASQTMTIAWYYHRYFWRTFSRRYYFYWLYVIYSINVLSIVSYRALTKGVKIHRPDKYQLGPVYVNSTEIRHHHFFEKLWDKISINLYIWQQSAYSVCGVKTELFLSPSCAQKGNLFHLRRGPHKGHE